MYTRKRSFTNISGITDISSWISSIINSTKTDSVHTVTFMDEDNVIDTREVEHNDILYNFPDVPDKEGYDGSWDYDSSPVKEDITVYPKYEPITYNISYVSEYGEANPVNKTSYTIEDERFNFYAPINGEAVGRYFLGWYTSEKYEKETKISHVDKGTFGDITLYAKWVNCAIESVEGFEIDYETETLPTISKIVDSKTSIITLSTLVKVSEGCTWTLSTDIEGFNEIESKNISLNTTGHNYYYLTVSYGSEYNLEYLIDVYKLGKYSYSFVVDEKVVKEDEIEGNLKIEKIEDPTKEGYTFKGWTIDGENIVTFPYETITNVSFKALFTPNKYQIELDYQNEKYNNETKEVYYDESITLPSPTKEGYTFVGWQDKDTHQIVNNEFVYKYDKSITLEAVYKANKYTINIDKDGDGNYETTIEVTFGETITIDDPEISGKTFINWTDSEGNVISSSYTHEKDSNIYIKANWDTNIYSINYNVNGGTNSSNNPNSYTINDEIIFEAASKYGYTFEGWYLDSEFNNKIEKIEAGSLTDNIELYAKFVANKYELIIKDDNGNTTSTSEVYFDSTFVTPDEITKEGHTFVIWKDQNGNEYEAGKEYKWSYEENITLTPVFKINKYEVTVEIDNPSAGIIIGNKTYEYGDDVIIYISLNEGYGFLGWYDENDNFISSDNILGIKEIKDNFKYYAKTSKVDEEGNYIIDGIKYKVNGANVLVVGYTDELKENVCLQSKVQGKNVTTIFDAAFKDCLTLKSLTIPSSVISIGNYAFDGCSSLTSIIFKKGLELETIGDCAFEDCSKLTLFFEDNSLPNGWNSNVSINIPIYFGITDKDIIFEQNGINYLIKDGKAIITRYFGNEKIIVIPETINVGGNAYDVTGIGRFAFYNCSSLTSVTFGDNSQLESIGSYAFYNCSKLTNIVIPSRVTSIGSYAFYNCSKLTNIVIPSRVTSIGSSAFYCCSSLENVYYEGTIEDWCNITFVNSTANPMRSSHFYMKDENNEYKEVTSIEIPDIITSIGDYQFFGFDNVTSIVIPSSVTSIGSSAFRGCSSLETITLPFVGASKDATESNALFGYIFGTSSYTGGVETKQYYGTGSYDYITYYIPSSLKEVIILEGCTSIGYGAFYNCKNLASITIPSSVTSIGKSAFYNCSKLTNIVIPSRVTSIGESAFYYCSSLENVYYEGTIEEWCNITFVNSTANPMRSSHFYMKDENNEYKEVTSIEIPDIITSIGDYQFFGFDNVTSIVIPSSVTSIGSSAFRGCSSLETITLPFVGASKDATESNALFGYIFGTSSYTGGVETKQYYGTGSYDYITYYIPSSLKEVIILEGCTSIGYGAFYNCKNLASITIPSSVTSIGKSAFYYCSSLTSVTFGDNSQLESIGSCAFYNCGSLTSILIPNNVTSIGSSAFRGCSSLTSVTFGDNSQLESIGSYAFYNCSKLTNIVIPSRVTSIGESAFYYCSSLTSVTFGDNSQLESIGSYAFYNCSKLTNIVIPSRVTSIGKSAFYCCSSLENVYYEGTIEEWCKITFGSADANPMCWASHFYMKDENNEYKEVTCIEIPDIITSIGDYQFFGFDNVTSIVIPSSVTSIGSYALSGCSSLTSITIPSSVTSIGDNAFYKCSSLTIYCEAESQPSGWNRNWKSIRPVYWGVTKEDIIEINGIQYLIIEGNAVVTRYVGNDIDVVIPKSIEIKGTTYDVTLIGSYALSGCSSLANISIPSSVISIGTWAFSNCSSLISITIPSSVTSVGSQAFKGCSKLIIYCEAESQPSGWNSDWNSSYGPVYWGVTKEDIIEINGIQYLIIDGKAIITRYVGNDIDVVIPRLIEVNDTTYNVISIGSRAFSGYSSLENVYYEGTIEDWCKISFSDSSSNPMLYASHFYMKDVNDEYKEVTSIEILETITSIGDYQFYGFNNVTSIVIPNSVTSIGWGAFYYCSSLTSVTFGDNSQLESIGQCAFYNCSSLTSIVIPSSVTSIGDYAFYYCSSLTSITIPSSVTSIEWGAFYGCSSLTSITIPNSVTSIGDYAFYGCSSLENVYYEGTIEDWCKITFGSNDANPMCWASHFYMKDENNEYKEVTCIEIPDTITSIGNYQFYGFSNVTSIVIPSSVTSIGYKAFRNCSSLTIYCEAYSQPSGWNSNWNPSNRPVVWNYKK